MLVFDKKDTKYAINRAMHMLSQREDSELDNLFRAMDNMFRSYWTLPDEIVSEEVKWIHRVTSTDPHDAVRAGTRTLATVAPKVTLHPLMDNEGSRKVANDVEKSLEWIFQLASRRKGVTLLRDIVLSSILYDEVVISVWSLPYQMKVAKQLGRDVKRLDAMKRYGDFIIEVHNPRDVVVEHSDLMAERVLYKKIVTVQELVDMWGMHDGIKGHLDANQHRYATIYDYNEIGWRTVWCYLQEDSIDYHQVMAEGAITLVNEETPYNFLPIVAKIGGTSLTLEERYRRIPLLWSVHNSGQWETQNILETLLASEALAYSVSPRYAVTNEFDTGEAVDIDFRDPARIVNLKRGQSLQDLRPPQLNQGIEILADRISNRMDKSTVPRVLQSGDYPSGSAFASLNLATQSGMKSLTPYKELAEQALSEMFITILNWIDFNKEPVRTYIPRNVVDREDELGLPVQGMRTRGFDLGGPEINQFDVENLYLTVELTEDVPTDMVAKTNTAGMMVERLNGSIQKALEFIGDTDPQATLKLREAENLRLAENEADRQRILNQASLENMKMQEDLRAKLAEVEQMKMQLEQAMQEAQAGGQGGPPGGGMPPGEIPMGPNGAPGPAPNGMVPPQLQEMLAMRRGNGDQTPLMGPNDGLFPGSNPAEGDMPPAMGAPGQGLREGTQQAEGE